MTDFNFDELDWKKLTDQEQALRRITSDIWAERRRQDKKFGEQNMSFERWMIVLGEETGEACKASLEAAAADQIRGPESAVLLAITLRDDHQSNLRVELVQAAAVLHAMIECGDRNDWWPTQGTPT